MKKQFPLLVMLILVVCLFTACGQAPPSEAPPAQGDTPAANTPAGSNAPANVETTYKETIIIAPANGFSTQDVQNCNGIAAMSVYHSVFNTLVDIDVDSGKLVPDLALSWEAISDTLWEFKLRDDVNFHDGTHFTAEDVKFTIERGLTQSKTQIIFAGTKSIDVIDDYTVRIETETPNHDFVNMLIDTRGSMLSKKAFDTLSPEEANQIGTGAFKYVEWVEGDHVTITRNDDYWGELPKTKTFVIQTMMEPTTRMVALQAGEVDLIQDPLLNDVHLMLEDKNVKILEYTGSQVRFFCLNLNSKPLNDPLVRQAIAHGINRDDYLSAVYENFSVPYYNFQHPSNEYYIDGPMGAEYNPQKARELLAQAGYPNGLTIDLLGPQEAKAVALNSIFQAQMADIGIKMNVQNLETITFVTSMESHDYVTATDWTSQYFQGIDKPYRTFFYAPPGGVNYFGFSDARLNELIDAGRAEFDETKRKEIYTELQNIILNETFCIFPICIEPRLYGANAKLEGLPTPGSAAVYTNVCVPLD